MYVFREGRHEVPSRELLDGLAAALSSTHRDSLFGALLRAGELECALLDAASPAADLAVEITNGLAAAWMSRTSLNRERVLSRLASILAPPRLAVSPPEGFAYYALHPARYADAVARIPIAHRRVIVVGIRSIGTTLGAVAAAAIERCGVCVTRFTVRPGGHPYNRLTEFSSEQQRIIAEAAQQADFLVVDEGPGLSGSSFLSVGDALTAAGVPRDRIAFVCSRRPVPQRLCARDAAARWSTFRAYCVDPGRWLPAGPDTANGTEWRASQDSGEDERLSSWPGMCPPEYFSATGRRLYQFEGYGRYGADVHARAIAAYEAGFGAPPRLEEEGFASYPMNGRPLRRKDLSPTLLAHIADYCAWRVSALATERVPTDLSLMLRVNLAEEFGNGDERTVLAKRAIIPDAAMGPDHWVASAGGFTKLDLATHGDDHFYPGPTDIAWDLAGVLVEWDLDASAAKSFLDRYLRRSGDDPGDRLAAYLDAYAAFRMGFCRMAAEASIGTPEEPLLWRDFASYRARLERAVPCVTAA